MIRNWEQITGAGNRALMALLMVLLVSVIFSACATGPGSGGDDVILQESFVPGETNEWHLEADDISRATLVDGQLQLEVSAPNTVHYATLLDNSFSNFSLDVDVTQLAGSPTSSFGILFRMMEPAEFYRFELLGDGHFLVERHDGADAWTRLSDGWVESDAINAGLNATNTMGIVAVGRNLTFYVNGQLLAEFIDGHYGQGSIALDAGTFGQPGLQVVFDNLVVRQP